MGSQPAFPKQQSTGRTRKDIYKAEYAEAKKGGERFFPETVFKDAVVALIVFAAIVLLAVFVPVELDAVADPTSTTYNPRPEWYFLFLFQFLKYFPGSLESLAAAVIPGLVIIFLILLPFLDTREERHPVHRLEVTVTAIGAIAVVVFLSVLGAVSPSVNPPQESRETTQGRRLYTQLQCAYCHSINGIGGAVGPDLAVVTRGLAESDIAQYLRNPAAMIPKTLHPKLQFTSGELTALSAYLASLGAVPTYTAEAPKLFQQHCAACHRIAGTGGTVGPDLSAVGSFRSAVFLNGFIANPKAANPASAMPAFDRTLSAAQIADLANYLAAQRGAPAPPATPAPLPVPATPRAASFARDVMPLLQRSCLPCHGSAAQGGLNVTTYNSLMTTGAHAPTISAGQADNSLLYGVLVGPSSGVPQMPPGGAAVPPDQLKLVRDWINEGARNN
ncbi:MAG: c-type cytochrome [Chloroflexi bacterium]|nr:c-type cytochrome [Chloroflexota bacterium]